MRRLVLALVLVLPFAAVPSWVGWWAEGQAARLGEGLSHLGDALDCIEPRRVARDQEEVAAWRAQLALIWDETAEQTRREDESLERRGASAHQRSRGHRAEPQGVFISAERVLALVRQGARPTGIYVDPRGERPGGLLLMGVSGLGVGLEDGDILTHALGQPAVSEAAVVGAVIRARGAREPRLSGRIWRHGKSFPLVVTQPYLQQG